MKVIHGSLPQDNDPADFKTCPVCGSICFNDMDTCFGCLHHFADTDALKTTPIPIMRGVPQSEMHPTQNQIPAAYGDDVPVQGQSTRQEQRQNDLQTQEMIRAGIPTTQTPKTATQNQGPMISRHLCADAEGRPVEITISINLQPLSTCS